MQLDFLVEGEGNIDRTTLLYSSYDDATFRSHRLQSETKM